MTGARDADVLQRLTAVEAKLEDVEELKEDVRTIRDWVEQQKGASKVRNGIRYTLSGMAGTVLGWLTKGFSGGA